MKTDALYQIVSNIPDDTDNKERQAAILSLKGQVTEILNDSSKPVDQKELDLNHAHEQWIEFNKAEISRLRAAIDANFPEDNTRPAYQKALCLLKETADKLLDNIEKSDRNADYILWAYRIINRAYQSLVVVEEVNRAIITVTPAIVQQMYKNLSVVSLLKPLVENAYVGYDPFHEDTLKTSKADVMWPYYDLYECYINHPEALLVKKQKQDNLTSKLEQKYRKTSWGLESKKTTIERHIAKEIEGANSGHAASLYALANRLHTGASLPHDLETAQKLYQLVIVCSENDGLRNNAIGKLALITPSVEKNTNAFDSDPRIKANLLIAEIEKIMEIQKDAFVAYRLALAYKTQREYSMEPKRVNRLNEKSEFFLKKAKEYIAAHPMHEGYNELGNKIDAQLNPQIDANINSVARFNC